ncbi:MAG: hypothetical protein DMD91_10260 [Candidatus Rokuibacteriota bacterium]|nr:MAG: hypothetical protein DMD91_10260 [Candidatus Rokubacteria bacterium]
MPRADAFSRSARAFVSFAPTKSSRARGTCGFTVTMASSTSSLPFQERMPIWVIRKCSGPSASSRRTALPSTPGWNFVVSVPE